MGTDAENWLQETFPYKYFFKNFFKHFKNMCLIFRGKGELPTLERERNTPPLPLNFYLPFEPEKP